MCRRGFVLGERRINTYQTLNGTLKQHEDHHNAEYLKTVAGHVHHNGIHWDLLGWRDGDLPRFLHLKRVGLVGSLRDRLLLLLLALKTALVSSRPFVMICGRTHLFASPTAREAWRVWDAGCGL